MKTSLKPLIQTVSTGVTFRLDIPESLDFIEQVREAVEAAGP